MKPIVVRSLSQQIVEAMRESILSGNLQPGTQINLEQLAARWHVSPTPVRDAVRALEEKGLLQIRPRVGVFVSDLDQKAFSEIFEIRIALECEAVTSAVGEMPEPLLKKTLDNVIEAGRQYKVTADKNLLVQYDDVVHTLIADYCPNRRLAALIKDQHDVIDWVQRIVVSHYNQAYQAAFKEHLSILKAFHKRDAEKARQLLRSHLEKTRDRTLRSW